MSAKGDFSRFPVRQFAERFRSELIPLSNTFSYFSAAMPLSEEDIREYLQEPIAALPPSVAAVLPKVSILLVPYVEKASAKDRQAGTQDFISIDPPPARRQSRVSLTIGDAGVTLAFGLKEQELDDYHYRFFRSIATLMADRWTEAIRHRYAGVIRDELTAQVHGEVDEDSWQLKQSLLRRQNTFRRDSKAFREYVRQSYIDTLTLYLHGICCDIDVETAPRQLPSRSLRRRLEVLAEIYPPGKGYAVFPENLDE
ncbi:MAG: hypothetical protein IT160_12330 [Bryobacterales bacterium]|nr:hypothetical protein [Bryobacterales bacterium]